MWEALDSRAECLPLTSSARSWGVSSSTFRSRESAPASHRVDEMLLRPRPAARCRGVQPLSMRASTRAPAWRRNCTRPRSWVSTARCSAVFPLVPSCGGEKDVSQGPQRGHASKKRGPVPGPWARQLSDGPPHLHINVSSVLKQQFHEWPVPLQGGDVETG